MKYYLVEKWNPDIFFEGDAQVIALNQEVVYYFDKNGIEYELMEDYYSSGEVRGDTKEFLLRQLKWFNEFDEFLFDLFPKAKKIGLKLATTYYYWLKYMFDNVILVSRVLQIFIEKANPSKVIFVGENYDEKEEMLTYRLHFRDSQSVYSRIIERVCEKFGIELVRVHVDQYSEKKEILRKRVTIKRILKNYLSKIKLVICIRNYIYGYIYYCKFWFMSLFKNKGYSKTLALSTSNTLKRFYYDLKRKGSSVYLKVGKIIIRHPLLFEFIKARREGFSTYSDIESPVNKFLNSNIMEKFNIECGFDVSDIFSKRVEKFIEEICPVIINNVGYFVKYYDKNNISYVITDCLSTPEDHAAIIAARFSKRTKSVGFAHGADVQDNKIRFFHLDRFFDIYFCATKEEAEHEDALREEFNYDHPEFHQYSYLLDKFASRSKKNSLISCEKVFGNKKPVVLFIPIMYLTEPQRPIELSQPFPMEYVKFHKALIKYMSSRTDFNFVWKGFIPSHHDFDLPKHLIEGDNYTNIVYDSGKLSKWLNVSNRVFCDIASTAFYESLCSKKPTVALYRQKGQRIRDSALKSFGKCLQGYCSEEEAIRIFEEFLNDDTSKYLYEPDDNNINVINILNM